MFEAWQEGNRVLISNIADGEWQMDGDDLILTIRQARELASALLNYDAQQDSIEQEWEDA